MRKITQKAVRAFYNREKFTSGNTSVYDAGNDTWIMALHGNPIAKNEQGRVYVTLAGWPTVTTRERLNGLDGVRFTQKDHEQYLNGEMLEDYSKWYRIDFVA